MLQIFEQLVRPVHPVSGVRMFIKLNKFLDLFRSDILANQCVVYVKRNRELVYIDGPHFLQRKSVIYECL